MIGKGFSVVGKGDEGIGPDGVFHPGFGLARSVELLGGGLVCGAGRQPQQEGEAKENGCDFLHLFRRLSFFAEQQDDH